MVCPEGWEMNAKELKTLLTDWRVAMLLILVVGSLVTIYIYPSITPQNGVQGNLQFGLDLQQGAWLQLEFRAEVIGFTTDRPLNDFVSDLSKKLDTEVQTIDATHLEIRKYYTQEDLTQLVESTGGNVTSFQPGVSKATADDVKQILENKINTLGTKDAKVNTLTGLNNVARYVRVELAGVDMNQAQAIVGKQGKFEIRIQTIGNETEHVLYGDSITSVQTPAQEPVGSNTWGVGFTLSSAGATAFRDSAIKYGATVDPTNHHLIMLLDNVTVYSAPLSEDLASRFKQKKSVSFSRQLGKEHTEHNRLQTLKFIFEPVLYQLMSALRVLVHSQHPWANISK